MDALNLQILNMSIERYFPKATMETYGGERIHHDGACGYPIHNNPEEKLKGNINSVIRRMQDPDSTPDDIQYCITANAKSLKMDPKDLQLLVEDRIDQIHRENCKTVEEY